MTIMLNQWRQANESPERAAFWFNWKISHQQGLIDLPPTDY